MINKTELRKGNVVSIPECGIVAVVESIGDKITIDLAGIDLDANDTLFDYSFLKPVALTPEVLEKCGFKPHTFGEKNTCYLLPYKRNGIKEEAPLHDILLLDYGVVDSESTGKYSFAIREKDRDIQFGISVVCSLHELQNGYYFLTGQELPYKP